MSGAGDVLLSRADREIQSISLQQPLHESGKILLGTVRWQAYLTPLAQAGVIEYMERAVREVRKYMYINV